MRALYHFLGLLNAFMKKKQRQWPGIFAPKFVLK